MVWNVVISDDNTIAVYDAWNYMVTLYVYDGHNTWHVGDKLQLEKNEGWRVGVGELKKVHWVWASDFWIFLLGILQLFLRRVIFFIGGVSSTRCIKVSSKRLSCGGCGTSIVVGESYCCECFGLCTEPVCTM